MQRFIKSISLLAFCFGACALAPKAAHADFKNCTPTEVIEFSNRIHVRCASPLAVTSSGTTVNITFIAISNSTSAIAARFLAMANAAIVGNKVFTVDIPFASTTNTTNCLSTNCRTPAAFGLLD